MKPSTIQYLGTAAISVLASTANAQTKQQPNVIIILADDLGYGDHSCYGNPYLKTPNIDKLHDESIRFTDFHVAPMSSPTRGQLLTGVDCLRNGCMATSEARSTIREEYPLMSEMFLSAGYSTGMFGKWHVGSNWPHRPMDRGFETAIYFQGYGLTDLEHYWNCDYYDPYYFKNGELKKGKGYCNDIWFNEAMNWMQECQKSKKPFFCYLPSNMAHHPEWIDSAWSAPYKGTEAADFYGMIANLDMNMGRLDSFLHKSGLYENTIFVYLTDNGSVHPKVYNAGMTGGKCATTEGGHRVPLFIRWPKGKFIPVDISTASEVQDVLPTLLDLCKIKSPSNIHFDGVSVTPLMHGKNIADRMFVVQYYHHDVKKYDVAVIWNNWRYMPLYRDELYDIKTDPGQKNNIAANHADVVAKMKAYYEQWWSGVEPRINDFVCTHIGSEKQKEVLITSVNWVNIRADGRETVRQPKPALDKGGILNVMVESAGTYVFELRRWPREADAALNAGLPAFVPRFGKPESEGKSFPIVKTKMIIDGVEKTIDSPGTDKAVIVNLDLKKGKSTLQAWFCDANGNALCGSFYVYVKQK